MEGAKVVMLKILKNYYESVIPFLYSVANENFIGKIAFNN
jgi:hypothetical protein